MPANKKYLLKTRLGRTSKILASLFGGLLATCTVLSAGAFIFDQYAALVTVPYLFFFIWPMFMALVYWVKKPWVSWVVLLSISLVSYVIIYFGK